MKTQYEFLLPRGYIDDAGVVHRRGVMRLATARDELEPLRDPTISGPDDPRLTILVLARVIERLGDIELVTAHEIQDLFAVDLAYLQDFYGVINFGSEEDIETLLTAQEQAQTPSQPRVAEQPVATDARGAEGVEPPSAPSARPAGGRRAAIEEIPQTGR
ncbi:hypothetical protein [Ferrimicrobium sp.]|uniref:hypothetical protein n=1 Tax=Ferrimicrobium sp. TaxID=2926050 RepID=UPI002625A9C2|nr:hypothetical protein [Ferrimicrobium sp.]